MTALLYGFSSAPVRVQNLTLALMHKIFGRGLNRRHCINYQQAPLTAVRRPPFAPDRSDDAADRNLPQEPSSFPSGA
jgi:hypothetical protein